MNEKTEKFKRIDLNKDKGVEYNFNNINKYNTLDARGVKTKFTK